MKTKQKKPNQIRNLFFPLLVLFLVVTLSSCKKENPEELTSTSLSLTNKVSSLNEGGNKNRLTKKEARAYINERLTKYAKVLAKLATNKKFRTIVNEAVAKKFDGDNNVLLQDLGKILFRDKSFYFPNQGEKQLVSGPSSYELEDEDPDPVDLEALEDLLMEPFEVNETEVYPQIYIPFFGSEAPDPSDSCLGLPVGEPDYPYPLIVPYEGDETVTTFDGWSYDIYGAAIEVIGISECQAKRHTTWAITLNERGGPGAGATNETSTTRPDIYIPSMKIKVNKESWIKGGSEVAESWIFSWYDGKNPTTNNVVWDLYDPYSDGTGGSNEDYKEIDFFTRNQISNQTLKYVDFNIGMMSNWKTYSGYRFPTLGNYMYLVIFEYDNGFWENLSNGFWGGTNSEYDAITAADGSTFITNVQYASNEGAFIITPIKIVAEGSTEGSVNTSNFSISTGTIQFSTAHR